MCKKNLFAKMKKAAPTSAATATTASSGTAAPPVHVQEFTVRIPKNLKKMHHVMRFNATLKVDFAQWKNVKMERENNMRDARAMEEDMPKFGAGSEYNRDQKEEFRRKKYGFAPRKYKQGKDKKKGFYSIDSRVTSNNFYF